MGQHYGYKHAYRDRNMSVEPQTELTEVEVQCLFSVCYEAVSLAQLTMSCVSCLENLKPINALRFWTG